MYTSITWVTHVRRFAGLSYVSARCQTRANGVMFQSKFHPLRALYADVMLLVRDVRIILNHIDLWHELTQPLGGTGQVNGAQCRYGVKLAVFFSFSDPTYFTRGHTKLNYLLTRITCLRPVYNRTLKQLSNTAN